MITCNKCRAYIPRRTVNFKYNKWKGEVKDMRGDCWRCGNNVKCDYEDFEELGIDE